LIYRRQRDAAAFVIVLNLAAEPTSIVSRTIGIDGEILLSTNMDRTGEMVAGELDLRANEGVIIGTIEPRL
jgi:alpha-glucosidase